MKGFGPDDEAGALAFYRAVEEQTARAVLDFLIDRPGQRADGAAIATALGLPRHTDIARATYAMGEIAAGLGHGRPWTEAQLGYAMPEEQAALLRAARSRLAGDAGAAPDRA